MALKNFSQFTPQTVLSATDFVVGYRSTDEIRTDLDSLTVAISGLLISKGFTPGGALGTIKRVNYRYTIDAGENLNAVSGLDDYGLYLSYTSGQLDVYRNGSHLVDGQDFVASNGTQVTGLSTMSPGDVIDIVTLSAAGITISLSGAGSVFTNHYRYTVPVGSVTVGGVDVSGPDDLGSTLNYASPNLEVYLNGSHLVYGLDYTALNGSLITMSEGLSAGDVVDVSVISAYDIGGLATLSTGVFKLRAGAGIILNPANGVGDVTITGNTFALTGGNIIINVGSTRFYKTFQSAIDSLSSFALDPTAVVTISADPETFNTTSATIFSHPYGSQISVTGTRQDFSCLNDPVVSVSGGFTFTNRITGYPSLSATLRFNPLSAIPSVGDYIIIHSVSGRNAAILAEGNYANTDNNNNIRFRYPGYPNYYITYAGLYTAMGGILPFPFPLSGAKAIITVLSAGTTNHLVRTIAAISGTNATNDTVSPAIVFSEARVPAFANLAWNSGNAPILTIGTPSSYRGTTFTQVSGSASNLNIPALGFSVDNPGILSFSDTGVATKDYLNPGDWIFAIGQARQVVAVSANNNCVIDRVFYSGTASGRTATITVPTPFFIKTHFERYAGLHRVAAVNGNDVTIECFKSYASEDQQTTVAALKPAFQAPMPLFGVESLANSTAYSWVSAVDPITTLGYLYNQNRFGGSILKTRINFQPASYNQTNPPNPTDAAFAVTRSDIRALQNMVIDGVGNTGLYVGYSNSNVLGNNLGVTGNYLNLFWSDVSQILMRSSAFATPFGGSNGTPRLTPNPDGSPTVDTRFTLGNSVTGYISFCSFRNVYYAYGAQTAVQSCIYAEGGAYFYNRENGDIVFLYVYGPGQNAAGGNGYIVSSQGNFRGGRIFQTRTNFCTYNTYVANYNANIHVFGNSSLTLAALEGEVGIYICYASGYYGIVLPDGNSADLQQNYCVGNVTGGVYFYQSNRASDVGYLASWNSCLNDVGWWSAGSNVFYNNRTGGGVYNNRVVAFASSTYTSQKINLTNYNKYGNGTNLTGGLTDGVFDTTNDNLVKVT